MNLNLSDYGLLSNKTNQTLYNHLSNLFIDEWTTTLNYSAYLNNCNSSTCTYTVTNTTNYSYTITLFISLYGGLILILRSISSFLVNILSKLKYRSTNRISLQRPFASWKVNLKKCVEWIKQLNLFKVANQRTENDIKQQKLTTRVYLILLSSKITLHRTCVERGYSFYACSFNRGSPPVQFVEYSNGDDTCSKSIIEHLS